MKINWTPLTHELSLWRTEQLSLPIWWRDDDAIAPSADLDRLLRLADELSVPVHLAVIPRDATPALARLCAHAPQAVPLVHGWAHQNHATDGQKKAEFGHSRPEAIADARRGLDRMQALFGPDHLAMFVPPWNRIHADLVPELATLGYAGLSAFGPRAARLAAPGLVQINTHLDPINWRGDRGLVPPAHLIDGLVANLQKRRLGEYDAAEPLGLLTHHLVHDRDIWEFTQGCLSALLDGGAVPVNLMKKLDDLP